MKKKHISASIDTVSEILRLEKPDKSVLEKAKIQAEETGTPFEVLKEAIQKSRYRRTNPAY